MRILMNLPWALIVENIIDMLMEASFSTIVDQNTLSLIAKLFCYFFLYMAKIHQEQHFIKNMQVVSLNRVHSTHSCETNKCRIFKLFFFVYQIKGF